MSLERKDVRAKLDPEMHEALAVLADIDRLDIAAFIEREITRVIRDRLQVASETHGRTAHLGISGMTRELPGMTLTRGGK